MIKKILKKNPWNYDSDNLRGCSSHKNLYYNKNKVYPKAICHRIKTIIFL